MRRPEVAFSALVHDRAAAPPPEASAPILIPAPDAEAATAAPRLVIAAVTPSVENGRFAVKQTVGEHVTVEADVICDGHNALVACLLWRAADNASWSRARMQPIGNDRFQASFPLQRTGRYCFTVEAWIDQFTSYRGGLQKLHDAGRDITLDLREGCDLVTEAARRTPLRDVRSIALRLKRAGPERMLELLLSEHTAQVMARVDPMEFHVRYEPTQIVDAERKAARFAAWYELFPRSQAPAADRHGTFGDVIAQLPHVRAMGFDVLYFPPIHPIGKTNRKGRNNSLVATEEDPGSPYAIGSEEGGHDAIHPELGSFDDWRRLCEAARAHDLEIALDFAIQCSPDHPWLREHPEWFSWRADGSIRFAENPPKKYEDIVNVSFYAEGALPSLWLALRDIVLFWVSHGVRVFRVDNPHTKPLPFWEWLIAEVRGQHPDVIFLAEAFTRPKVMYQLAKLGFSQSYTYFTWRNTPAELREYMTELTTTAPREFFRPHFFVNTPDINPTFLHTSGRPGFLLRAALAATLSGLWGIYNGFELCEAEALDGHEEYRDSEKYQLRQWDHARPGNIVAEIQRLNYIRRTNPALQTHLGVRFIDCSNEKMLCYIKATPNNDNILLIAANFDPHSPQACELVLDAADLGAPNAAAFDVEDLMHSESTTWQAGPRQIRLDPDTMPFAIWRLTPATKPSGASA